ncbi:hypothetical protein N186_03295 [Thermofilum adornatum]|uniref:Uncharacterized protein n=2 Tax=Thermofilum adornatum TaxID=1365176 RepID=S6A5G4_9CREN|nr:hypothetical protein [Thermofilum adornatum]AGT35032.1 hypothetical protein N186_03295 [Thermofilum adornatum]AJB42767.1 hypothetical protein TCARB_1727 [Thermofilum adornatum 1505]
MAQGNIARVKNRWKEYFYLGFYTRGVLKLAEKRAPLFSKQAGKHIRTCRHFALAQKI